MDQGKKYAGKTEASGTSETEDPLKTLLHPHRAQLCGLDPKVHPVSRKAASGPDGAG